MKQIFNRSNYFLTAYMTEFYNGDPNSFQTTVKKVFSLNIFFTQNGMIWTLQEKDYNAVNMVFSFIAASIDKATESSNRALLTAKHKAYFTYSAASFSTEAR